MRNIVIRQSYEPPRSEPADPDAAWLEDIRRGHLTADELLRRYCTMVYAQCGSYEEAARRLKLDRRTIKAKIEPDRRR